MPILGIYLFLHLGLAIFRFFRGVIGEAWRLATGAYRSGYAITPADAKPGSVIDLERFIVARDPISLPAHDVPGEVARVADVGGFRFSYKRSGWWWHATTARVVEILPPWVVYGPSGRIVIDVISATLDVPAERAMGFVPALEARYTGALVQDDEWRVAVGIQVRTGVEHAILGREARAVRAELASDGAERDGEWTEAAERAFQERVPRWSGAIDATLTAGLAAAFVDELAASEVERYSADWQRLIDWHAEPALENGVRQRAARIARSPLQFIERHPTISVLLTVLVFIPGVYFLPTPTLIAFAVLLVVALVLVIRRSIRLGRRIRHRRWAPTADIDEAVPSPDRLRRAMGSLGRPVLAVTTGNLVWLLRAADVWVALRGPMPSDQTRSLRWLAANGQMLPMDLRRPAGGIVVLAFTDAERHRRATMDERVAWTAKISFQDLVRLAREQGATGLVIDPGWEPTTVIDADGFDMFLTVATAETAEAVEAARSVAPAEPAEASEADERAS
jgi:hypothetical protein